MRGLGLEGWRCAERVLHGSLGLKEKSMGSVEWESKAGSERQLGRPRWVAGE